MNKILKKVFAKLLVFAVLGCGLYFGGQYLYEQYKQKQYNAVHMLAAQEILRCAELSSIKMRYSDVVTIKKSGVLGMARSYSIVKYSGIIRAGIKDITQVSYEISDDRRSAKVRLPRAVILGNEIESQTIFDEAQNIFVPISTQNVFSEIDAGRNAQQKKAIDDGFLKEADDHAVELFTQIFSAMGFSSVKVELQQAGETVSSETRALFQELISAAGAASKLPELPSGNAADSSAAPAAPFAEPLPSAPKLEY